jgi:hypothetical protein
MVIGVAGARALAQVEGAEERTPQHGAAAGEAHDAATGEAHDATGEAHGGAAHADEGPVPPHTDHTWPGAMLLVILFMFIAAAAVGPIVRAHAPPEMPPTHSHDEPPGASYHHGHGGTINPVPETVRDLEDGHGHSSGHGHH